MRIIIVEDDSDLRASLVDCLELANFEVESAASALSFYQKLAAGKFDIAIIDVGLPDQNGFEIASFLQERNRMGIILLTARSSAEDRLRGFVAGADLYFVKPVEQRELVAAIGNLARRLGASEDGPRPAAQVTDNWTFDRSRWLLIGPNGGATKLTTAEMRLIDCLVKRPGQTTSRAVLLAALGYENAASGNRSLEALVKRVRRKIADEVGASSPIQTVHGEGYVFSAGVNRALSSQ